MYKHVIVNFDKVKKKARYVQISNVVGPAKSKHPKTQTSSIASNQKTKSNQIPDKSGSRTRAFPSLPATSSHSMAMTTPVSHLLSPPTPSSSPSCSLPTRSLQKLQHQQQQQFRLPTTQRRDFLLRGVATVFPLLGLGLGFARNSEAREVVVGSYLPPSPSDPSFVVFKASPSDTPALRAGNIQPYQFVLPPSWKQTRVANILSGNYCQPKCAEPWVEVKFEDEKQGRVQVVASPIIRLTNKPNATIEDIGSPEKVIASLGPFVTGNTYDPDELLETSIQKNGDQTYYTYQLETPFALTGSHNLAKATAKGKTVVLLVVSANDKQWPSSQKTLKAILDSFQI